MTRRQTARQRREAAYIAAVKAEADAWIKAVGTAGWHQELARRRAARVERSRNRREAAAVDLVLTELGGEVIQTETTQQHRGACSMIKPCLTCGEPISGSYCPEHVPTRPETRTRSGTTRELGYSGSWQHLSRRARRLQPFCSDCGTSGSKGNPLTADHLPGAWERRAEGKPLRLGTDVDVACKRCNSARGKRRRMATALDPGNGPRAPAR